MKGIENRSVKLDEFDISVNQYLTYAQIQQIADTAIKFDKWSERQQNIDMLMLYHATDIGEQKLNELGHDALLQSGVIGAVRDNIVNYYDIIDAINHAESVVRLITKVIQSSPHALKVYEDTLKGQGASNGAKGKK